MTRSDHNPNGLTIQLSGPEGREQPNAENDRIQ